MTKYGAIRTEVDGVVFHSRKEAQAYCDLKLLAKAGLITNLALQPKWDIYINGIRVFRVILDFSYWDSEKKCPVYIDVKGGNATRTPVSRLKHKCLEAQEGIKVSYV